MEDPERNGWLALDGHFFPCERGKHGEWPVRELHISEAALETLGWLRIVSAGEGLGWSHYGNGKRMTTAQARWLREHGLEITDADVLYQV